MNEAIELQDLTADLTSYSKSLLAESLVYQIENDYSIEVIKAYIKRYALANIKKSA